jgi:hypothetical protein
MIGPTLRRHGTTIALLALTAAAGVAVFVVDRGSITTTETIVRKRNLLPAFRDDEVSEVRVDVEGRAARLFRGEPDDAGQRPWQVEIDGARYPAEEPIADQYLASLRDGTVERRLDPEPGSLAKWGLDAPRATIEAAMGPKRFRVVIGGPAPTPAGALYVEVPGHGAAVISAQLAAALLVRPDVFRARTLLPYGPAAIEALALDGEGGPRRLRRSAWIAPRGAGFRFDGSTPEGTVRAAGPALDAIWDALARISAGTFLADAEADRAAARVVTVAITPRAGAKRLTFDLGGACPGHPDDVVAIRREEGARVNACVPHGVLEALSVPAAALADRRLVGARVDEVTDIKIETSGRTIALARSASQWHEQQPVDRPLEPEVGRAFLDALLDVTATAFAPGDGKELGLDPPRGTVRVASVVPDAGGQGKSGERIETLQVGAEQGGVVHVRRVEDGAILTVSRDAAEALLPGEIALRPRKVFDEPAAAFRALRVESPGRVQRFLRARDGGGWTLGEPKIDGIGPDPGLVAEVVDLLGGLSAERWVGAARPEHGLDRPRLTLEAEVGGDDGRGKRTIRVALGAPAGKGSFARAGDDPSVFVVSARLEAAADRWLLDRTLLPPDVSEVKRVTLTAAGGKKLVLEGSGGALQIQGDPAATARAAAVREALGDLASEGVVSVGPPLATQGLDKPTLLLEVVWPDRTVRIRFGAGDVLRGTHIHYARREGALATYAVAQGKLLPLLEAVEPAR